MSKKKILFVTNNLYGGGAEKVLETLIKNLNKDKYDITIYTLHKTKILETTYQNVKIKHFYLSNGLFAKIHNKVFIYLYEKHPKLFYKYFIREKYDVEIAFIEGYATKIIASSNNKKSKKIAWVHVDLIHTPWTDVAYNSIDEEKECYKKFNRILCVSNDVKKSFIQKYNINSNVLVQYNPVDEKLIINLSQDKINVKKNKIFQFVTVGRLEHQKGYDRLLKVINKLKEEGFKFNVWIVGTGRLKEEFENFIKANYLESYINLLGFQKNPYPYIKNADAFICSSRSEGFSTVVTEALILNKSVFTTNCAGMHEVFGNYQCGIIFENDEDGIYNCMKNLLCKKINLCDYEDNVNTRKNEFVLKKRMGEIEGLLDE